MSGASVNPARSLGPAAVNNHFVPEFWIYFIGPLIGATAAASVHGLFKALAYQTANPGQDGDGMEYYRLVAPGSTPDASPGSADGASNHSLKEVTHRETTTTVPVTVRRHSSRGDWKRAEDEGVLLDDVSPVQTRASYNN